MKLSSIKCAVFSLCATQWTVAHLAPLSVGFSRPEYWNGLPCSPPGYLPDPGIKPGSPALHADYLLSEPPGIWTLNPMTDLLIGERRGRFETRDTQGRRPCEDGGRCNDAATSQGLPATTRSQEQGWEKMLSEPPERINPADTLISEVWPLQVSEEKFCCFKLASLLVICHSSPGSRIHLVSCDGGLVVGLGPTWRWGRDSAQK